MRRLALTGHTTFELNSLQPRPAHGVLCRQPWFSNGELPTTRPGAFKLAPSDWLAVNDHRSLPRRSTLTIRYLIAPRQNGISNVVIKSADGESPLPNMQLLCNHRLVPCMIIRGSYALVVTVLTPPGTGRPSGHLRATCSQWQHSLV